MRTETHAFWNGIFRKRWFHDTGWCDFLTKVLLKDKTKMISNCGVFKFLSVLWTVNIWCIFRVRPPIVHTTAQCGRCLNDMHSMNMIYLVRFPEASRASNLSFCNKPVFLAHILQVECGADLQLCFCPSLFCLSLLWDKNRHFQKAIQLLKQQATLWSKPSSLSTGNDDIWPLKCEASELTQNN